MQKYVYSESVFNTLNIEVKHWDKFSSDKINGTKNAFFFLCDSYTRWSTWFVSLKLCVEFSIFDSVSFLYFCLTKCMDTLTLKRYNSFQNKNNRKTTHSFTPRPLIFKLQQEVLKFKDIYLSWRSPKTDLVKKF